jgi:hypothetical protein
MECAICFDEIGAARATLGCSHSFHINCIVSWYYRQNMACDLDREEYEAGTTASSCPCCRAAPAAKLDDIPNETLINFVPMDEDDSDGDSNGDSDGGSEDEELAAASPRTPRPVTATPVPPLDFSSLELRWTRTGSTSWAAAIADSVELPAPATAEPLAWDGERTPSPPPDSLVSQVTEAARKIQTAWRALRGPSPLEFV